ncbi:hypothetical protein PUNSTDRAFT_133010 [Punctularia strigosozonata HHB-11173 SS5]|uniref:uncharacterized protein n=1 Tax=Punctularia strigosozonata (strain HHB-11173) TaxID=741275 RepID=UPI0004417664|nr:uncharacterized protein PUNSTDRAFT_133010 [Punctularia strigosozonata HHB-11173 SS5]EIN10949.1 hypothetical protein PUNSTDRAFT_133010 [Punctularia strigosozonata HHB-11173 SS5]
MPTASQLKDEGNALFSQQKWKQAHAKYTEAIALDEGNAILWANRAACGLNLKRFQEALVDAQKATTLDPGYAKAWARLATAQDRLQQAASIESWRRALASLPAENLSPSEQKQKEQYTAALKEAESFSNSTPRAVYFKAGGKDLPWDRAAAMKEDLRRRGENGDTSAFASSAWVILGAHENFEEGMMALRSFKKIPIAGPQGFAAMGSTQGLECLSNGIMRDQRVFHIKDQNFINMYNDQATFQAKRFRAWTTHSAEQIIEEAQKRVRDEGWNATRPALSTTVRGLLLRGFLTGGLQNDVKTQVEFYSKVLHVLEWGQRTWKNVPPTDRGTIFDHTFVRGVRDLHLEAYMQACNLDPKSNKEYSFEKLFEEAQEQLDDIKEHPITGEVDPGFVSSFHVYPQAHALAIIAFYYKNLAQYGPDKDVETIKEHLHTAAKNYLAAAHTLPPDDEKHAWYLFCGTDAMFKCGRPLKEILPIVEEVRDVIPKYKAIWENSALAQQGLEARLNMLIEFETEVRKALDEGTLTMDSQVHPDWAYDG